MTLFVPNPDIVYVDQIEDLPLSDFGALPDHPAQRQTALHAVHLIAAGVLNEPLDQHREVAITMIGDPDHGDTIEKMIDLYRTDRAAALARYAHKQDGHTRFYSWSTIDDLPVPETLRATVYAVSDVAAATKSYNAMDSILAAKGAKDMAQTTVRIAQISPRSDWLKQASGLSTALNMTLNVVCGGGNFVPTDIRSVLLADLQLNPLEVELHRALPHLAAVNYFKSALQLLDSLEPSAPLMPMAAPYVAGYLSILQRDPERGKVFLETLQGESGRYSGGLMDAFFSIKMVGRRIFNPKEKLKTTPKQRNTMALSCVLNAYNGWAEGTNFTADKFPTESRVITSFNPVLRNAANDVRKAHERAKIKARQRQTTVQTVMRQPRSSDRGAEYDQPSA